MNKWIIASGIAMAATAGIYVGSPYYAAHSLKNAAVEADTDSLEAKVDFPSVRESLKSQFSAMMMTKMQTDPEMKNNPFAGLAAMLAPAMIDRMVDAYVTPDGIAATLRGQKPTEKVPAKANPDIETTSDYVGLDRFRVRSRNAKLNENGPAFLFERRGFASWKLIKVELPENMMSAKPTR